MKLALIVGVVVVCVVAAVGAVGFLIDKYAGD